MKQNFLFLLKKKKGGERDLNESLDFVMGEVLQSFDNLGILVAPWLSSLVNDISNKQSTISYICNS